MASLSNVQIQKYCNALQKGDKQHKPLSSKSIQNIHGILHMALEQAVAAHVLQYNPSDHVKLPKVKKPDLKPLIVNNGGRATAARDFSPPRTGKVPILAAAEPSL